MARQTLVQENIYNQEIRDLFKQLIYETESLYQKVISKQYNPATPLQSQPNSPSIETSKLSIS